MTTVDSVGGAPADVRQGVVGMSGRGWRDPSDERPGPAGAWTHRTWWMRDRDSWINEGNR